MIVLLMPIPEQGELSVISNSSKISSTIPVEAHILAGMGRGLG